LTWQRLEEVWHVTLYQRAGRGYFPLLSHPLLALILLTRSRTVGLPFSYIYIIDEKLVRKEGRKQERKKKKRN
jgi:hypothetical protein